MEITNRQMKDFTPMQDTITLHGLGFIQMILPGEQRLHVWHPDLPRRKCYAQSAVHNHRFAFRSRVLKGLMLNVRADIELVKEGTHSVISHNGPRSETGSRLSYPVAECNVIYGHLESYGPGDEYDMPLYGYHHTPVGHQIVVTLMQKKEIGSIHANSLVEKGTEFDYSFDRYQLTPAELFEFVREALEHRE